jgi:hypothetical protein
MHCDRKNTTKLSLLKRCHPSYTAPPKTTPFIKPDFRCTTKLPTLFSREVILLIRPLFSWQKGVAFAIGELLYHE